MGDTLAKWLYEILEGMEKKPNNILNNSSVREDLRTLEPTENIPKKQKEYVLKKLSLCSMIVVIGVVLSTIMWIKEGISTKVVDNCINRNAYGGGEKTVALVADDGENRYDISVNIEERNYTQAELTKLSKEVLPIIENLMLGKNQGFDKVEYDIRLIKSVEGYPFEISWYVDETYIDYEGHLVNNVLKEPQIVEITAQLDCQTFQLEHTINMMVYSKAIQPKLADRLAEQIHKEECNSRTLEFMTLPSEFENQHINWHYKKEYQGLLFLVVTPMLALLVYYGKDKDLHKQVEDREAQMCRDYPEIVSALALLIGAGMTVPNAWDKISTDYKYKKEETGRKRYAYEEMLLTVYEMESGVAQTQAYEQFGRRCRIPRYNKLSTLLSQNLRKGAANLPMLLKEEAADAFEERKHIARQLGEKAGTKLLAPMMMLLGMIMVVIMIPAFKGYL